MPVMHVMFIMAVIAVTAVIANGNAVCNTCYFHNDSNGYNGSDDHSA